MSLSPLTSLSFASLLSIASLRLFSLFDPYSQACVLFVSSFGCDLQVLSL